MTIRERRSAVLVGLGAFSFVFAALACSSGDGASKSEGACVPGQSVACFGPSGCEGYQVCDADGSGFEACDCSSSPSAGQGGSPTGANGKGGTSAGSTLIPRAGSANSGGGGAVGTNTKASGGTSATSTVSVGGVSNGSGGNVGGSSSVTSSGGGATSCPPASMVGWKAPNYVPARPRQKVCTDAEIQAYLEQCMRGGNCSAFSSGGASEECGTCLSPSAATAAALGPIVQVTPSPFYRWETNFAGCAELLGAQSCAPKLQAASTCAAESCSTSCGTSSPGYEACLVEARGSTCNAYSQAAICITDATIASRCSGTDFAASVLATGRVFCGS